MKILRRLRDAINRWTSPPDPAERCSFCRRPIAREHTNAWHDTSGNKYDSLECYLAQRDLDTPTVQRRTQ